ncbi:MAG: glucosidase [Verrucomicrobiota bacterium]
MAANPTPEHLRLAEENRRENNWKRWGPYISERQWGTVREDYSANGDAWNYLPHDHARSRTYRWGEDGLLGICDRECRLCFAVALWNERDPFLKERLFGLSNPQGNHGEDVKEAYYYLDSTPTHSYLRGLYKYPQGEYPYRWLIEENGRRGKHDREFEIHETGIFDQQRYFDVFVEYAKAAPDDILIRIRIENRGDADAPLHVLPTLWFRNTWSWGETQNSTARPTMQKLDARTVATSHPTLGDFRFEIDSEAPLLFTENETNNQRLFNAANPCDVVKDGFHEHVVHHVKNAVRDSHGTKVAPHYRFVVPALGHVELRLRLRPEAQSGTPAFGDGFDTIFAERQQEADAFYKTRISQRLSDDQQNVVRQAYAGLLWTKQYYNYVVKEWMGGDPATPPPPPGHAQSRNSDWTHVYANDVLSMPDKWEYPWYAAWDLAFHMVPMARVDPDFAKDQLQLLLREWYMHPSGQIPAYEWNFGDVNPPVHAWACWRVYKISAKRGERDTLYLERCFQKLLVNFTWWVNRKDVQGRHIFSGGFLGLDNIGLFDRSSPLPSGQSLAQADGTAWMAFYCGTMLSMALELALTRPAYEDIASKFFEHFIEIVDAMNAIGGEGLWDEQDGFYYDQLLIEGAQTIPLRVRSLVGIIPLLACEVLDQRVVEKLPGFRKRMRWFIKNRPDLSRHISCMQRSTHEEEEFRMLSIPSRERLVRVLHYVLDENEFLSPFGIRSLSRIYEKHPYTLHLDGADYGICYEPAESRSNLFGGNSNWRGPIWFPINYLLIEVLERYHHFYGESLQVEFPTGSGNRMTLDKVAAQLALRLSKIFTLDEKNRRPCFGDNFRYANDPNWQDNVLFHEYFHADIGCGLGANHQTGWTALITRCLGIVGRVSKNSDHPE